MFWLEVCLMRYQSVRYHQIKIKKNQMSFQISSFNSLPTQHLFEKLIHSVQPIQRKGLHIISLDRFKKEMEHFTEVQAKNIFHRLIEKSTINAFRKNWKVDETNYLLYVVDKYCLLGKCEIERLDLLHWEEISKFVPSRNGSDCKFRFLSLTPTNISNSPWSSVERNILLRIIQNQDSKNINWKEISYKLYELSEEKIYRTGKQCKEHFTCFLKPNLKKGAWTEHEDYELILLFLRLGKKWSKMTKFIDGRNQNSIKNRFFLMFQNKKDLKLSNSELVKVVRRRKQKIQKKLSINQDDLLLNNQENINLTPTVDDSLGSSLQNSELDQLEDIRQTEQSHNEMRQQEKVVLGFWPKMQNSFNYINQQYERYIDF